MQANSNVPKLSQSFPYGTQPIKGINIGGWLVLEVQTDGKKTDLNSLISPHRFFLHILFPLESSMNSHCHSI